MGEMAIPSGTWIHVLGRLRSGHVSSACQMQLVGMYALSVNMVRIM